MALKKFSLFTAAAALAATSFTGLGVASPAQAQWGGYYGGGYYGGGYYSPYRNRGHYRHRDRIDVGDVIGTVLVVGAVASVIGAISDNDDNRRDRRDRRYRDYDDRYDNRDYVPRREQRDYRSTRGSNSERDRASDACSWAAEGRAGDGARVRDIRSVRQDGQGWRVDGSIDYSGREEGFTCGYTNGQVDFVQLGQSLSMR